MLSLRDVSLSYGDFRALDGIDLDVHDGEIVCVLGPSGSGKSSMCASSPGSSPAPTAPSAGTAATCAACHPTGAASG